MGIWGSWLSYVWNRYGALIIFAAVIIVAVIAMTKKKNPNKPRWSNVFSRALGEED